MQHDPGGQQRGKHTEHQLNARQLHDLMAPAVDRPEKSDQHPVQREQRTGRRPPFAAFQQRLHIQSGHQMEIPQWRAGQCNRRPAPQYRRDSRHRQVDLTPGTPHFKLPPLKFNLFPIYSLSTFNANLRKNNMDTQKKARTLLYIPKGWLY